MPETSDLYDAFAQLEQQIPEGYRSELVEGRLARLRGPETRGVRAQSTRLPRVAAAALVAAAAVAAIAVGAALVRGDTTHPAPAGSGAIGTPGNSYSAARPSASPAASTNSGAPTVTAPSLPADPEGLMRFVTRGAQTSTSAYRRGASQSGQPMRPTPGSVEFTTPSRNISCGMITGSGSAGLVCQLVAHSWASPPRPDSCSLNWVAGALSLTAEGVTRGLCLGGPPFAPISSVLPYGSTLRDGVLACRSESAFLACVDVASGHGFAVSREVARAY